MSWQMNRQSPREPISPHFTHDCDDCTFIGHYEGHDIYRCEQGGIMPTIIARWGSDGPQYSSGPMVAIGDIMLSIRTGSWRDAN